TITNILNKADINVNSKRPWDIQVHNENFYSRLLAGGSLALGESYMEEWWDCQRLDVFFDKILSAKLDQNTKIKTLIWPILKAKILNLQSEKRAYIVGEKHYDIGNDLYKKMLDKRMIYSCAYWKNAKTLDKAQEAKLDLICKKMNLKPGIKILDIGCGWGGFLKFAAKKYKIKGVGITVSKEQVKLAKESCKGLPIEIRLQDYRDLSEKFDRIISIGMFEHVGPKNYKTFMKVSEKSLKENGLMMLHTIGANYTTDANEPWVEKYIFPNGKLPSLKRITKAAEKLFVIEDIHNFGPDYNKTIMAWEKNFVKNWSKIKHNYDKKFYRMWRYYLLSFAGSFRARNIQLWQIVLSKNRKSTYNSIR
ncbi:MAG: cyclopropane fatty acyl phospholipid synthase, partial [Nanoarchaeota archaeon]